MRLRLASTVVQRRPTAAKSLEIINHTLGAIGFEGFFDEFEMQRMHLIIVLRLLVWEDQIESDLIGLINDGSMAWDHPAHMKTKHTGDRFQVFFRAGNQFLGGRSFIVFGPKDDNVREHKMKFVRGKDVALSGARKR